MDRLDQAWRALYAAEGSDWFWWYSHRNSSDQDALFDRLFRDALIAADERAGMAAPEWLQAPIRLGDASAGARLTGITPARGYVTPVLTGAPFPSDAWSAAATLRPASASSGSMQRATGVVERLFVGWDAARLHLRLDVREPLDSFDVLFYLGNPAALPANQRVDAGFAVPDPAPRGLLASTLVRRDAGQSAVFLFAPTVMARGPQKGLRPRPRAKRHSSSACRLPGRDSRWARISRSSSS